MPTARPAALDLLSPAAADAGGRSIADAQNRRDLPGPSGVRITPDGALPPPAGLSGQSQTDPATDAADGPGSDLPEAEPVAAKPETPGLSLLVAESDGEPAEPGLGDGCDLRSAQGRVSLPVRRHGLVQPGRPGLGTVEHPRRRLLRRGRAAGHRPVWGARDLQHRPGMPVHLGRVHGTAPRS